MNSKDVLSKIINKVDESFSLWNSKDNILPSRFEIYLAGYMAGVNNTKKELDELFINDFNERVKSYDKK